MDYQRMWFLLKEYIETKNSHGKNELAKRMTEIEIQEVKSTVAKDLHIDN